MKNESQLSSGEKENLPITRMKTKSILFGHIFNVAICKKDFQEIQIISGNNIIPMV